MRSEGLRSEEIELPVQGEQDDADLCLGWKRSVPSAALRSLPDRRRAAPFRVVRRNRPMIETRLFRSIVSTSPRTRSFSASLYSRHFEDHMQQVRRAPLRLPESSQPVTIHKGLQRNLQ